MSTILNFRRPKNGVGGPATGAYGCSAELAPFLPAPLVVKEGDRYRLDYDRPQSVGKVREFLGNTQVILKAYAWARAMSCWKALSQRAIRPCALAHAGLPG